MINEVLNEPGLWLFLAAFLLCMLVAAWLGRLFGRLEERRSMQRLERGARLDAVKRSRAVLTGQISEQLAPFLPDFPCQASDARFMGKPVDFIAFDGLSAGRVDRVLFIEVKTGGSALSPVEKSLKAAIQEGRVEWREYRI